MPSTLRQGRTDAAGRLIKASPAAIYQAFVDPSALMQWLPPGGMSGRVLEFDPRTGGRYRIELAYEVPAPPAVAKTTERTDISEGRFLALEPSRRIVQSVEFVSTDPAFAGVMVMTWSLETEGDGTRVTITAENVPHGISKEDHDAGLQSSLKNLAHFVERPRGTAAPRSHGRDRR